MATYLDGVEDGRRDITVRIEREAVAVTRDMITTEGMPGSWLNAMRTKRDTMIGLIKQLDPIGQSQSFQTIYERIESEALRQIEAERTEAKLAGAQVVS